jgi:aminoglycoside phosphotransferase (APT) family kinase protein
VLQFLARAGLAAPGEAPGAAPLPGGVSSDIWLVGLARGPVCVKRALARLRVEERWEAPVERNRYESLWMETAHRAVPGAAPEVLARDDAAGLFVMEYLDPARHPLWKEQLRRGITDIAFAARVGASLAAIHAATAGSEEIARAFPTDAIFHAIRLEPYLLAAARRHPELAAPLEALAARTAATRKCLVHGDVSPKNILVGPHGPVFLDAECAWYGDPAFDAAFCLNHLLLKCLWTPGARAGFLACFDALAGKYLAGAGWEPHDVLEGRIAALLPGLLLARVDGKSPVEYVTEPAQKEKVRAAARRLLLAPPRRLGEVRAAWEETIAA